VGGRTPLGFNAPASAAAVRGGLSAIEVHQTFVDKAGDPMNLAQDAEFEVGLPIAERIQQMLSSAIRESVGCLNGDVPQRTQCWIGLPESRPGISDTLQVSIARSAAEAGGCGSSAIRVLTLGHASGLIAIQAASEAIATGKCEVGLVAGADSYHDPETLEWLDRTGALMSATNRNGFPPGEAAGACVLASVDAAQRLRLPVLGVVAAAATSVEPNAVRSGAVCTGAGLTAAIREAASVLDVPREAITATYCDLNGQRYRSEEFVYTLLRVQGAFVDAHDYLSPADCWGDVGAASGPLFVVLALAAVDRGYAVGTVPLMWAGSESGYRSAVLLRLLHRSGEAGRQ
jgi:3-oxoacyl-[acyl-carrier-protein] synthase-1